MSVMLKRSTLSLKLRLSNTLHPYLKKGVCIAIVSVGSQDSLLL